MKREKGIKGQQIRKASLFEAKDLCLGANLTHYSPVLLIYTPLSLNILVLVLSAFLATFISSIREAHKTFSLEYD